jgi:hypothetical protein
VTELLRAALDWQGEPVLACEGQRPERLRIRHRLDGEWTLREVELERALEQPIVQPLPGRALLVAGRDSWRRAAGEAELNGWVFGAEGELRDRLLLGDGVEDVQATASGELWVSYTLQGTTGDYGLHGWGRLSPEEWVDPVGYSGLVKLDARGRRLFEFEPPAGGSIMNDCYALNAWGEEAWVCYHPGFTLARIGLDGATETWSTGLDCVDAIALEAERVLLCRSGQQPRAWLARLGRGILEELRELALELPADQRLLGRGSSIQWLADGRWQRLEVAQAR